MFIAKDFTPQRQRSAQRVVGLIELAKTALRLPELVERRADRRGFITEADAGEAQTFSRHLLHLLIRS